VVATVVRGTFVDQLAVDGDWFEVEYENHDVRVHGFRSRRDTEVAVQRPPDREASPLAPTAIVPAKTCLYARPDGEAIGFYDDSAQAAVEHARDDWWTIALDTPWGVLTVFASGPTATELAPCPPTGP
jgi:hypothetical protein